MAKNKNDILLNASMKNDDAAVKKLLQNGANIKKEDSKGRTPLHIATTWGNKKVVKVLLEAGADPNKADKEGETSVHKASYEGHAEVLKLLLAAPGVKVNKVDNEGRTPLWEASFLGKTDIVAMLLKMGADANKADQDGDTPLYVAAKNGNTAVVKMLLAKSEIVKNLNRGILNVAATPEIKNLLKKSVTTRLANLPYRHLNNEQKRNLKPILLKRLVEKNAGNNTFIEPITQIEYYKRNLKPRNNINEPIEGHLGMIINNKNVPTKFVNVRTFRQAIASRRNGEIPGIYYKGWTMIPVTKNELDQAYQN